MQLIELTNYTRLGTERLIVLDVGHIQAISTFDGPKEYRGFFIDEEGKLNFLPETSISNHFSVWVAFRDVPFLFEWMCPNRSYTQENIDRFTAAIKEEGLTLQEGADKLNSHDPFFSTSKEFKIQYDRLMALWSAQPDTRLTVQKLIRVE